MAGHAAPDALVGQGEGKVQVLVVSTGAGNVGVHNVVEFDSDEDNDVIRIAEYIDVFGVDGSDGEQSDFEGFQDDVSAASEDDDILESDDDISVPDTSAAPPTKKAKKQPQQAKFKEPPGFNADRWGNINRKLHRPPPFTAEAGINFDVLDNANELFFLMKFLSPDAMESIRTMTNLVATGRLCTEKHTT